MARLTEAERLDDEQTLALLERAADRMMSWHPIRVFSDSTQPRAIRGSRYRAGDLLGSRAALTVRVIPRANTGHYPHLAMVQDEPMIKLSQVAA